MFGRRNIASVVGCKSLVPVRELISGKFPDWNCEIKYAAGCQRQLRVFTVAFSMRHSARTCTTACGADRMSANGQTLTNRNIFVTNGEAVLSPTGDCEISDSSTRSASEVSRFQPMETTRTEHPSSNAAPHLTGAESSGGDNHGSFSMAHLATTSCWAPHLRIPSTDSPGMMTLAVWPTTIRSVAEPATTRSTAAMAMTP